MFLFILFFLIGDLYLQTRATLIPLYALVIALLITSIVYFITHKKIKYTYLAIAFVLGLLWTDFYAGNILKVILPKNIETKTTLIRGIVESILIKNQFQTGFLFKLTAATWLPSPLIVSPLIHLNWHNDQTKPLPHLKIGDEWQFDVRLKRIHGSASPGAFDYEAFAIQENLRASGAIVNDQNMQFIQHHTFNHLLDQLRQYLRDRILVYLPQSETAPWLLALMLGEHENIPADD